ncbi:hypothetical protein F4781DRAFT_401204 [Annulohypoxylon bovei var. microspora]|nr:hypothetical protein F4781DRAFT_401204 [Annulohypoxylon bovei var. microspora]
MCVEVWNVFQRCNHRVYQSTFHCHIARRCGPKDDLTLQRTKFLPDKAPKLPPGILNCKIKTATRPLNSNCPECAKNERTAKVAGATPSQPAGLNSYKIGQPPVTSPSPGGEGIQRVRDSLVMLEKYRKQSS